MYLYIWLFQDASPKEEENTQQTQKKYTEDPIQRHTYNEGPQCRANQRTKAENIHNLEEDPLVTQPPEGGG
jgi:hypothetical protein